MTVRIATSADLPLLATLMDAFRAERPGGADFAYDREHFMELLAESIERPDRLVLILAPDRGFLLGILTQTPYSTAPIAQELVWYTRPEARGQGLRLFRTYLMWAEIHRAEYAFATLPEHSPAMERLGFFRADINYFKRLPTAGDRAESNLPIPS